MPKKPRTFEIMALFKSSLNNDDKSLIEHLKIEELESAVIDLGKTDLDSPYRLAMETRINELIQQKFDTEIKKKYRNNLMIPIVIAILLTLISGFHF